MTEELINMSDEYETRDGRAVRVLCVDRADEDYPVVAIVKNNEFEDVIAFTATGKYWTDGSEICLDLVKVKKRPKFRPGDVWLCRDGMTKVEILRTDLKGKYPIAGVYTFQDGNQRADSWTKFGKSYLTSDDCADLITKLS